MLMFGKCSSHSLPPRLQLRQPPMQLESADDGRFWLGMGEWLHPYPHDRAFSWPHQWRYSRMNFDLLFTSCCCHIKTLYPQKVRFSGIKKKKKTILRLTPILSFFKVYFRFRRAFMGPRVMKRTRHIKNHVKFRFRFFFFFNWGSYEVLIQQQHHYSASI